MLILYICSVFFGCSVFVNVLIVLEELTHQHCSLAGVYKTVMKEMLVCPVEVFTLVLCNKNAKRR